MLAPALTLGTTTWWRDILSSWLADSFGGFMTTTAGAAATMKVAQVPKPGADFQIVEREIPEPGAGHEVAGIIDEVGGGVG